MDKTTILDRANEACGRIAPLWPMGDFVAVNPFVGQTDKRFLDVAERTRAVAHGDMLMPARYFVERLASGKVADHDVRAAVAQLGTHPGTRDDLALDGIDSVGALVRALERPPESSREVLTFSDHMDRQAGSSRTAFIVEEISKWCSAYFDRGQSSWRMPWRDRSLFAAWQAAARIDLNPEWNGWKGFRTLVGGLPDQPADVIFAAAREFEVPDDLLADFFHRQLMSHPGWSGYAQRESREAAPGHPSASALLSLLAIRLAYDLGLWRQLNSRSEIRETWSEALGKMRAGRMPGDLVVRYAAQCALECAYQRQLVSLVAGPANEGRPDAFSGPPVLQAVFCIDVRSEVFRRALEAQSPRIDTIGFAGFFGLPVRYLRADGRPASAQCPVLLQPGWNIAESCSDPDRTEKLRSRLVSQRLVRTAWNAFKSSAVSCFSFVETAGLLSGVKLVCEAIGGSAPERSFAEAGSPLRPVLRQPASCCGTHTGIPLPDRVQLASGALRNMGLTDHFARFVLICGHGSASSNNPYRAALDCGACGGHAGDVNARLAAEILNDPDVRSALRPMGIQIPDATRFVAALHITTTDEVIIYDQDAMPPGDREEFSQLIAPWIDAASRLARCERARTLGLAHVPADELASALVSRSRDWAEVRPEWGLAGNAAFVAAPRDRTRHVNLGGRAFLHNYDPRADASGSVLELILSAPVVVASWINLQYYGSTVNNRLFGSGNKVLHNIVGTIGIWQGNGGDLQAGLPLQSLHDGANWIHEPLRLHVVVEAATSDIDRALDHQPGVRDLVENGWIVLLALQPGDRPPLRYAGGRTWEPAGGLGRPPVSP